MPEKPTRKEHRLNGHDYTDNGYYFITICIQDRECILSDIPVNSEDAQIHLSETGRIVQKHINRTNDIYQNLHIDNYVIMPNHLHFIICINKELCSNKKEISSEGISQFVSTLKHLVNKECGYNIWQRNYHDHIIRDNDQYEKIFTYIQNNPFQWQNDCFNV